MDIGSEALMLGLFSIPYFVFWGALVLWAKYPRLHDEEFWPLLSKLRSLAPCLL